MSSVEITVPFLPLSESVLPSALRSNVNVVFKPEASCESTLSAPLITSETVEVLPTVLTFTAFEPTTVLALALFINVLSSFSTFVARVVSVSIFVLSVCAEVTVRLYLFSVVEVYDITEPLNSLTSFLILTVEALKLLILVILVLVLVSIVLVEALNWLILVVLVLVLVSIVLVEALKLLILLVKFVLISLTLPLNWLILLIIVFAEVIVSFLSVSTLFLLARPPSTSTLAPTL